MMRLNRFLAQAGCGSRRACEELIKNCRVTINGVLVTDLATQVAPGDHVKVGTRLLRNEAIITAMLHKPKGYICTADDPEGRRTIFELLPKEWPRVFYVGRLDADSEGLLLITNDGNLAQRLTHPSYKLPKTYEVQLDREFDFSLADKLRKGLIVEGKKAKMEELHRLGPASVKVVLTQGLKRQIRLMFLMVGFKVRRLVRTEIGALKLGRLPSGQWELLSEKEVDRYFGKIKTEPAPPKPRPIRPRRSFAPAPAREGAAPEGTGTPREGAFKGGASKFRAPGTGGGLKPVGSRRAEGGPRKESGPKRGPFRSGNSGDRDYKSQARPKATPSSGTYNRTKPKGKR